MRKLRISFNKLFFFFLTLLFIIFAPNLFAENDIFRQLALSGKVISTPFEVNSRIVAITDGGFISTFSTDGYRKYERPLKNRPSRDYTVTKNGIIFSVSSNRKTISFFNPDGYYVWGYTFEEDISNYPVMGYDGRIFVCTNKSLYCFGITGNLRWQNSIPAEITEPIKTLNDGSLLCISTLLGKDSIGYRYTPYGDFLEEITFNRKAILTAEHEQGVLMLFSDGTFGCCSVKDNKAISLWASIPLQNLDITSETTSSAYILRLSSKLVSVLYPNGIIITFNTDDGTEIYRTTVSSGFTKGSLFYGAGKLVVIAEFSQETYFYVMNPENGELIWTGVRKKTGETIYFYTSDGYLLEFTENWVLSVSKPPQGDLENARMETVQPIERPHFYKSYTKNSDEIYTQNILEGFDELMMSLLPVSNPTAYTGIDPSLFEKDLITSLQCIQNASITGYDFSSQIGDIIIYSNSELLVNTALDYGLKNGYDPDSHMLKAIYTFINSPHTFTCSNTLYKKMCDVVSSICQFTGAEVFQNYGSRILVKFMSSGYSTSVKEYAVNVMKSLMTLQI